MPRRYRISKALRTAIAGSSLSQRELAELACLREEHLSRFVHGQPFGRRVLAKILIIGGLVGVAEDQAVRS